MEEKRNGNNGAGKFKPVWLSGRDEIAIAVGVNRRDIPDLVVSEGLPAFKWRGRWRLIPEDAKKWSRIMAKKHVGRSKRALNSQAREVKP